MKSKLLLLLITFFFQPSKSLLIRENYVYEGITTQIFNYYNCSSIAITLNTDLNNLDLQTSTNLRNFIIFISKTYVSTRLMTKEEFTNGIYLNDSTHRNKLVIFLNDYDDIRNALSNKNNSVDMSLHTWLIFFRDNTNIDEFFKNLYAQFNWKLMVSQKNLSAPCQEIVKEVYQIDQRSQLRKDIFSTWNCKTNEIYLSNLEFYRRRNNLFGLTLRAVVFHDPPAMTVAYGNNEIQIGGYYGELFHMLQEYINFSAKYILTFTYGVLRPDGTWTGGMNYLVHNVCDIFPIGLNMINSRMKVAEFTAPIISSGNRFFFKQPTKTVDMNGYISPFSTDVWITILCLIALISCILITIEYIYTVKLRTSNYRSTRSVSDNILMTYGAFCAQGMEKSPINSLSMIQFTTHFTAIIITATYAAIIISILTVGAHVPHFKTMASFYRDGTYKMGISNGGALYTFCKTSEDPIVSYLYKKSLKEQTIVQSHNEGFKRVCEDEKFAYFAREDTAYILTSKCKITRSEVIVRFNRAIAFPKKSPYRGIFNYYLSRARDGAIIRRLYNNARQKLNLMAKKRIYSPVDMMDVLSLILLLSIGHIFSIFILWCEIIFYRYQMRRKIKNIPKRLITNIRYPRDSSDYIIDVV